MTFDCSSTGNGGHNISAIITSCTMTPQGTAFPNLEVFCSRCGKSREDILKESAAPLKRTRKPKAAPSAAPQPTV